MARNGTYTVVENAGYVGECDAKTGFKTWDEAHRWMVKHYDEDERETLRPDIAFDFAEPHPPEGSRTYEC